MLHRLEEVEIVNRTGKKLSAVLEMPPTRPEAWAIFAHCFTCSKDYHATLRISRKLAERGIGVLRFDFTGLGKSEGDFEGETFSRNMEDVVDVARWLEANHQAPQLLLGHSLGGAAVIAARKDIDSVKAVVTLNAPWEPSHVERLFVDHEDEIEENGQARVSIGGRPFTITKKFLEDIAQYDQRARIENLDCALMVIHSPQDVTVGIENGHKLFETAMHPKAFISLDGADHLITSRDDAAYVADLVVHWVPRYLSLDRPQAEVPRKVTVGESGGGKYTQFIQVGHHRWMADEPAELGGADLGPTPYELLLAGLGACTSMTVRMYAEHKKIPLDYVEVKLAHEKIHMDDCDDCVKEEGAGPKIDVIKKEIHLEGDFDEKVRKRMLEIAERCPVNRTLQASPKMRVSEY